MLNNNVNPRHQLRRTLLMSHRRLYPGARTLVGALIVVAGCFGFLPVLGFWMIPVGLVVMATDLPPLRRYLQAKLRPRRLRRGGSRDRSDQG